MTLMPHESQAEFRDEMDRMLHRMDAIFHIYDDLRKQTAICSEPLNAVEKVMQRLNVLRETCREWRELFQRRCELLCNHVWEEDMIDMSPEHSQSLLLCTRCQATRFPPFSKCDVENKLDENKLDEKQDEEQDEDQDEEQDEDQ